MIALYVLAGLVLLLLLPLDGIISYDHRGFLVRFALLGLPIGFSKEKPSKKKSRKKPAKEKPKEAKPRMPRGGSLSEFLPYLRKGGTLTREFLFKLRVPELTLHVCFGGKDDPAEAAIAYGGAWAFIGTVLTPLRQSFRIGKARVDAACDFTAEEMTVVFFMRLRTNPAQLLLLLFRYAAAAIKIKVQRKAVSNHESSSA